MWIIYMYLAVSFAKSPRNLHSLRFTHRASSFRGVWISKPSHTRIVVLIMSFIVRCTDFTHGRALHHHATSIWGMGSHVGCPSGISDPSRAFYSDLGPIWDRHVRHVGLHLGGPPEISVRNADVRLKRLSCTFAARRSLRTYADPNVCPTGARLAASYQHVLAQACALSSHATPAPCRSMLATIYSHHRRTGCSRVRGQGYGS